MTDNKKTVSDWQKLYDTPYFHSQEAYAGGLGADCTPQGTDIRLWSPVAEKVTVRFFENGDSGWSIDGPDREGDDTPHYEAPMQRGQYSVWHWHSDQDLHGVYYDFVLTIDGERIRSADPCAKACGVNGQRSMLVDLRRTDPESWEKDGNSEEICEEFRSAREANPEEPVIYELHVKDFSWEPAGGFPASDRGKYSAFMRTDTTLNADGVHPTGLSYLKRLGVNCIQLMPVYDFGSVDEAGDSAQYNWGYDPVNMNVPEGSYSSDPYHGEIRIRELKEAVLAMHRQGFRVIMDVVYNHTFSHDSWLQRTVPWYFYRADENGVPSNGSGCGNDIASERPMCARYILDSVLYWAREYHMDGFRFDLMGLLDVELMKKIRRELDREFGKDRILMYGEPWAVGFTAMGGDSVQALKSNIGLLPAGVGMFCDDTRDCIKGSVFDGTGCGFVNGARGQEKNILRSAAAWCGEFSKPCERPLPEENRRIKAPSQVLSYVSCHDNYTLRDKLTLTTGDPALRRKQYRLAAMIYLTCQGTAFMLSGEEFGRTKNGNGNSYNATAELNQLSWTQAWKNTDLVEYYRGLVALRKRLPALCDKSAQAWKRILPIRADGQVVSFLEENSSACESSEKIWKRILITYNASGRAVTVRLPETDTVWMILADTQNSFLWRDCKEKTGSIVVPAVSGLILGEKAEA